MWQKAGQVSSQDIENLSMAGILGFRRSWQQRETLGNVLQRAGRIILLAIDNE